MKRAKFLILSFMILPILLFSKAGFHEPWGKDSSLAKRKKDTANNRLTSSSQLANTIINFHQKHFSPIDGPRSSFRPTSSRYMQLAMQRYGALEGFLMGCDRLLRENAEPWIYQTIVIDDVKYKFDPAVKDKFSM